MTCASPLKLITGQLNVKERGCDWNSADNSLPVNRPPFGYAFGAAHLTVIFLTIALPFLLALIVRRTKSRFLERSIVISISALLVHELRRLSDCRPAIRRHEPGTRTLPLQLCDWAMFVIIVALWTGNRRWLEVAYFWGIGGTLQAIITPNLPFGFPDLRFISFFVAHSGIIIGVVFLMLIYRFRPRPMSNPANVFAWTEFYFVVAFIDRSVHRRKLRLSPA